MILCLIPDFKGRIRFPTMKCNNFYLKFTGMVDFLIE